MVRGFVLLLLFAPPAVNATTADEPSLLRTKVSLGFHYSSGSYGEAEATEIYYVPLIARVDIGSWSAAATVPYLRIDGPATVIDGVQTVAGKSDGIGDIALRASYLLLPPAEWMPFLDFIGRLKIPTASRADGLGTGEVDYGFELEASKAFGAFTPFVAAGYRILGSPPGSHLRNVALAAAGTTYQLLDNLNIGALIDYRQAASDASGTRLEVIPYCSWKVTQHWSLDLYATAGLANGSPDAGTGVQIAWTL